MTKNFYPEMLLAGLLHIYFYPNKMYISQRRHYTHSTEKDQKNETDTAQILKKGQIYAEKKKK